MRYLLTALYLLPALVSGQELYTFKNGEVADADEVNENFQNLAQQTAALSDRITALEESSSEPPADDVFQVRLETPASGTSFSGIKTISGWAIATSGIERIEIYIDDVYSFDVAYGGARGDVAGVFPDVENSDKSGFATRYNYNGLSAGEHTITAKAISNGNNMAERSATFSITKFDKPFISSQDEFSLDNASCSLQSSTISIVDALVDGSSYDISVQWNTAAQDFEIIGIATD
jgi:hypothetical protein